MWKHLLGYVVIAAIAVYIGANYGSKIPFIGSSAA